MGILRLLLAVVVVLFHCPRGVLSTFLFPSLAVQCFYAVSGFLMQLAIFRYKENGGRHWYLAFYRSRILRIMPLYWLFTLLTLTFDNNGVFQALLHNGNYMYIGIYIFNNTFILGQDILRFFTYNLANDTFHLLPAYTENYSYLLNDHVLIGNSLTVLGQSWTIAVEMWFYMLVPFILFRSNVFMLGLLTASIIFRVISSFYGYTHHTFLYGVVFNELAIFISGSLAARFYLYWLGSRKLDKWLSRFLPPAHLPLIAKVTGAMILFSLFQYYNTGWNKFPAGGGWGSGFWGVPHSYWAVIVITVLALPWLFYAFGENKFDRFLGELSYPIYISHMLVLALCEKLGIVEKWQAVYVLGISIILSVILLYLIEKPIDNIRHVWGKLSVPVTVESSVAYRMEG